jgi:hypothetical protein
MVASIFITILLLFLFYATLIILYEKLSNSNHTKKWYYKNLFKTILLIWLLWSFLFASYPDANSEYIVDGETIRSYDSGDAFVVRNIRKFIYVKYEGWLYISRIESVDDQQFRLYFKKLGLQHSELFERGLGLIDDKGNIYKFDGGGIQSALIVSAGVINLFSDDLIINYGNEFMLDIGSQVYDI